MLAVENPSTQLPRIDQTQAAIYKACHVFELIRVTSYVVGLISAQISYHTKLLEISLLTLKNVHF